MPKGSKELTEARREEIIDACAGLYETMSFRDITIRDIGNETSFTRTSIYNYFRTKEEIFLALLQREHEAWACDITGFTESEETATAEEFASAMAEILEKRKCMLKLMSMNIYDMEVNSRLENLVEFKRAYAVSLGAVEDALKKFFPSMSEGDRQDFVYGLFPFLFGVYPYSHHTEKQTKAMEIVGISFDSRTIKGLVQPFILKMLKVE